MGPVRPPAEIGLLDTSADQPLALSFFKLFALTTATKTFNGNFVFAPLHDWSRGMLPIDYAQNALLRRDHVLRFVPQDQCDLFRQALARLEQDGHQVCRLSLTDVGTAIELLHRISTVISAPSVIENWGMFEDWMNKLAFLLPEGRGCFFCMEGALPFWQKHTSLAGVLSNEIQSVSFQWAPLGTFLLGIYELR